MTLLYRANFVLLLCLVSSLTIPTIATSDRTFTLSLSTSITDPDSPAHPLITKPADIGRALLARDIATCGYISGNGNYPLTCPAGFTCTSTTQYLAGWACCNQIQCVGNYRKCVDYGAALCKYDLDATACSSIYTSILSCSDSAAPSCFVYARSTHIGDFETAYSYGCGASSGTVLALATTTGAIGAAASSLSSTSTNYLFPAPTTDNSNNLFTSSTTNPTSDTVPNSSAPSSNTPNPADSGLNTGSVIGIAVGAISAIGTFIGAYFAWKAVQRRRDRDHRPLGGGGSELHSIVRPYGRAPEIHAAPRSRAYAPPPAYGVGHIYQNNWR